MPSQVGLPKAEGYKAVHNKTTYPNHVVCNIH